MNSEKTIKERWAILDAKRDTKLNKARACSALTVPTLLPYQSLTGEDNLFQTYSSVQSRGVTSLASKILSVLIPLNDTPFFSFGLKNGREPSSEISEYLHKLSFQVYKKLISHNLREISYLAMQHLIVVGDVLVVMENDFSFRVIRLDQFVVRRDVNGDVKEFIYLEFISPSNAEPATAYDFLSGENNQTGYKTVYIRVFKSEENDTWQVEKELEGNLIDKGEYTVLPFIILRWASISGEDYGRSHVEDIYSDIRTLESYSRAMIQGMAAGSTFFMGVDPSGITEIDDLAGAVNGQWVGARKQDVFVISPSETINPQLQACSAAVDNMRKEVGQGFLLQAAAMPSGDRVTATAVRAIGNELETILGGTFSAIARDFMVPLIRRTIYLMILNNEIDQRMAEQFDEENGILNIEILTGLQSLSRESDITKLLQMGEMVRNLPPEAASSFKWEAYARALITAMGFDANNWVRSAEEIKKEKMEMAKAQQQMEMQKMFAGAAANAMGGAAQQDLMNTGGANIPPEISQQAMQMLGQGGMPNG
jgi:hypothetical protein